MKKTEKDRLKEIEKAKKEFIEKMKDGPKEVSSEDVAKLVGMEDEYKEAKSKEQTEPSDEPDEDIDDPINALDVLNVLGATEEEIDVYFGAENEKTDEDPGKNQMTEIEEILEALEKFRDERNWQQFHNTRDLALALSIEAAELNELFLWKTVEESETADHEKLREELADVFAFAFLLAGKHGLDVKEIVLEKIRKNAEKYPVAKSKGNATKYTDL